MSTRSIFPTGGARTPRLAMTAADAISLYRFEKANAAARHYDSLEAERAALNAAMALTWNSSKRKVPRAPALCACGCGMACAGERRTASQECWRRVRDAQTAARRKRQPRCAHCHCRLVGKMPTQEYCHEHACQLARWRRKNAARRARSSLTPNRKAS